MTQGIRGLYEVLITEALEARLRDPESRLAQHTEPLRAAEAADRVAFHLERLIRRAIAAVPEKERAAAGVALARELVAHIDAAVTDAPLAGEAPVAPGTVLHALLGRQPDGTAEPVPAPLIPLLDTALLTNAPGEPRVGNQILAEIPSAATRPGHPRSCSARSSCGWSRSRSGCSSRSSWRGSRGITATCWCPRPAPARP